MDEEPVMLCVFAVGLGQMIWMAGRVPLGLLMGAFFSIVYFGLGHAAEWVVKPLPSGLGWMTVPAVSVFVMVAVAEAQLARLGSTTFGKHLYVHARNGFYLNTLANRITGAVWPVNVAVEEN